MTPEAQRIAIAEACGKFCPRYVWRGKGNDCQNCGYLPLDPIHMGVPSGFDPLNDLNAMHEAEKVLKEQGRFFAYHLQLATFFRGNDHLYNFHATAAQRAEAFLRTLGKWEDGK